MIKRFWTLLIMAVLCVSLLVCTASASSIPTAVHCSHGNNYSTCQCFAKITQDSNKYAIGARITWQLSGSSELFYGPHEDSLGAIVTSSSGSLLGYSGQSFGYYYVDYNLVHESTAWMDFSF